MLFYIPFVLLAFSLALCSVRYMHFFQLNSYKFAEHRVWMARNRRELILLAVWAVISVASFTFRTLGGTLFLSVVILSYGLLVKPKSRKSSKKPLVYTPRVIRMLVSEALIFVLSAAVFLVFFPKALLPAFVAVWLLAGPYLCLAANVVNAPVEKGIRRGYTKEAISMLRSHPNLRVVGITGSYGKTSTKYYLSALLSERFDVLMTPGSYNTPMGVVKTVRESLRPTHEVFICEMGAKYVGDIKELCEIAEPSIGIISSIGIQHLDTFGTVENIVSTKLELLDYLESVGGKTVLGGGELIERSIKPGEGRIFCGEKGDVRISDVSADERGTSFVVTDRNGNSFPLTVQLLGAHNVSNVAAAVAVALEMGLTPDEIIRGARKIRCAPHRLEIKQAGGDVIIDDAYNANPAGTKAALAALGLFKNDCRIIVTPGMVELGEEGQSFNKTLGRDAAAVCDYIYLVGRYASDAIRAGAVEAGFPGDRICIYDKVEDAIAGARSADTSRRRVILLENDLPDNY